MSSIKEVERMTSKKKLLVETLNQLSPEDFEKFKSLIGDEEGGPVISRSQLKAANSHDVVELMVETYSRECVEVTTKVLMKMSRTDLVQRLSGIDSGTKEELWPPLVQRVETMASVIELLLGTLEDLSDEELKKFRKILWKHGPLLHSQWLWMETTDHQVIVFVAVEIYGQESVMKTKEALEKLKRTDLVQRLSDSSSGFKKKQLDDHLSALIHKVATMAAVKELLLETLKSLSDRDLKKFRWFLQLTTFQKNLPQITGSQLRSADRTKIVDLMMKAFGKQSVEVTREVFMDMNRTDVVQKLPETSSECKDNLSVDERCPALIQKVETLASVIELLLETLEDLSDEELKKLKRITRSFIPHDNPHSYMSWRRMEIADTRDTVLVIVQTYGKESVLKTKEALERMNRTDLVQRLSDSSSGFKEKPSVDERRSALVKKMAAVAAVKQLLLETLKDLSIQEVEEFRRFQQIIFSQKNLPDITWMWSPSSDRTEIVHLTVEHLGQQSVEVTREVFRRMKRTDLMQKLSETSSGQKEKHSVDQQAAASREATVASVGHILQETLKHISTKEFSKFRLLLQFTCFQKNLSELSLDKLVEANTTYKLIDLMEDVWGEQSVEVTREVLKDMNRTDLVEKLSEIISGPKEELWSPLVQRVETISSVTELLLEKLEDLSDEELKKFKHTTRSFIHHGNPHLYMKWEWLETTDHQDTVFLTVQTYGQESVRKSKEALKRMKKVDLVHRLSESSSGFKKKQLDEHLSALIHKVATMAAVKELLLETLKSLSDRDLNKFRWFLQLTTFQKTLPQITGSQLRSADRTKIVDLMMKAFGQKSVEVTREVFMDMNRTDVVQKLPETSSECKDNLSVDERCPALIQKVETMASVIELLLETLEDLNEEDLEKLKRITMSFIQHDNPHSYMIWRRMEIADTRDTVLVIVQTYGKESVLKTKEALERMNRTDLVQRLSDSSSGFKEKPSVDERRSALVKKVAAVAAVKQLLLETLNDLSIQEVEEFRTLLQLIFSQKNLPDISSTWSPSSDRTEIVHLTVEHLGQQSVEVTREVFRRMNRTDLMQKLSETSSGQKEKHSVDQPAAASREAAVASVGHILQETLKHISTKEFSKFRLLLQFTCFQKNLSEIPQHQLVEANTTYKLIGLMVDVWGEQSVEVTREILKDMNRTDLAQKLSEISSAYKGASRSLELEGCGSVVRDSSDWTKMEPEVNNADADEAPTYSLQSEAGHFECSVSGLRWVCKENASFKYQFCSWGGHMERMESRRYMPAGPLIDISLIAGKLNEVYLPHWVCIEDNPKILDKFAVLHIDDCGDVVEKASEVTASHVKLTEPIFSPRAVLMKMGFPVKIKCNVLMYYKPNTPFLKLHVFVIPHDPALQQTVDAEESSSGYEKITRKPRPDKYLQMQQGFTLTADIDTATIQPKKITLRYDDQDPNFYEVFIENPDRKFNMTLCTYSKKSEAVWTCEIRKDDYPNSGPVQAAESSTGSCSSAAVTAAGSSSGATCVSAVADEKHSVDEQLSAQLHKAATITSDRDRILKMLEHLKESEFREFKWTLEDTNFMVGLPYIPRCNLEKADMFDLVNLMIQVYSQRSVEVTKKVFKKINRNDLVLLLSDTSS